MSRRIISLFAVCMAVVGLCLTPVWGEDKPQANDNSTQPSVWTQIKESVPAGVKVEVLQNWNAPPQSVQGATEASIPQRDAASPQDFCPFTAVCFGGAPAPPCVTPGFPGGELTEYQDPAITCPPINCTGVYPFEVTSVTIQLSNCHSTLPCVMLLTPFIRDTILPTPGCPQPGPIRCSGQPIQVTIPPNTFCQQFTLPLPPGCCVNGPYFAGVQIQFPTGPCSNISPCWDATPSPCCSYWDQMAASFVDVAGFGGPGNLAIWSDGFLECQNNCSDKNHYKTWRLQPVPVTGTAQVKDQFMTDNIVINGLDFLSNPVKKVHGPDTFNILIPENHLDWYRMFGRDTLLSVTYQNQFESTTVLIDTAKYLLVPAQKLPHNPPVNLDHYKCYRIRLPHPLQLPVQLDDQFDQIPENITTFTQLYFCTPCKKNNDPFYDTTTHYVAYKFPPQPYPVGGPPSWTVIDQFPPAHNVVPINSEMLLVPTRKLAFTVCSNPTAPLEGDASGNLMLQLNDAIAIVNAVFNNLPGRPPCVANNATCWYGGITCRGDWSGNGVVALNDAIQAINYAFSKIPGCVGIPPCCWKPIKTLPCCHDLPPPCGP